MHTKQANLNDLQQTAQKPNSTEFVPDTSKILLDPSLQYAPKYEPDTRLGGGDNNPNTSQQQSNFTQQPPSTRETITQLLPPNLQKLVHTAASYRS
jgi:hypothetical protein